MEHIGRALLKVVHRVAQIGLLRVVEIDYVLALIRLNRQRFRRRTVIVVAADINLFVRRRDLSPERLILYGLCIVKHLFRVLLKVVHRVAQAGLLRVVDVDHVIAGSNRQRILIHAVVIVAVDINHFVRRRDHILERHPALNLLIVEHLVCDLLKVVHRVAQVGSLRVGDRYLYVVRRHRPAHNGIIRRITGDVRRCHAVIGLIRKRFLVAFRRFATVFIHIVDRQSMIDRPLIFIVELYLFRNFIELECFT